MVQKVKNIKSVVSDNLFKEFGFPYDWKKL